MSVQVRYLNPAGNITAVVLSPVSPELRPALSREIMAQGRAEQVGFAAPPRLGGDCRIEMMGGEFCGNAVRSYGYLRRNGMAALSVEISGAVAPVPVTVDPEQQSAFADMPLPLGVDWISVGEKQYPLIQCQGICHLLALEQSPDPAFLEEARPILNRLEQEAWGIMFLSGQQLTPAVYVRSTDSLVWESSCGSGSVAAAWYLAGQNPAQDRFRFREPGGEIAVEVRREHGTITGCSMGGPVILGPVEEFCWTEA
jgi:histidine racemase